MRIKWKGQTLSTRKWDILKNCIEKSRFFRQISYVRIICIEYFIIDRMIHTHNSVCKTSSYIKQCKYNYSVSHAKVDARKNLHNIKLLISWKSKIIHLKTSCIFVTIFHKIKLFYAATNLQTQLSIFLNNNFWKEYFNVATASPEMSHYITNWKTFTNERKNWNVFLISSAIFS